MNMHEIMRALGNAARLIYLMQERDIPEPMLDTLLSQPLSGLALLQREAQKSRLSEQHEELLRTVLARLPSDMPNGPVSIEDQGGFWLGFYQAIRDTPTEDTKKTSIYLEVEPERKAAYVKAAQRAEMKLVPWALAQLDRSASQQYV